MAKARESDVKMRGYLYKLPVSSGIIKKWNRRWVVLHATSHEGVVRLVYYDDEESELKGGDMRVINLRNGTGCCETSAYKSQAHAFQFSTVIGHHVFAASNRTEMEGWIQTINDATKDDKLRQKNALSKSKFSASAVTGEPATDKVVDHSLQGQTNPSELMGTYRVALEQNETTKRLKLSGVYSLEINPRTVTLIAPSTQTTIAVWRYQQIKSYARSKNQLTLQFGRSNPTGAGKLVFSSSCTREMFGVIHRNIKKLRTSIEKAREESIRAEVEQIKAKQMDSKVKSESRLHKGLRTKSMMYEVSSERPPLNKRASCPADMVDQDLIKMGDLPDMILEEEFDPLNNTYDTLGPRLLSAQGVFTSTAITENNYDVPKARPSLPSTNTAFMDSSYNPKTIPPPNNPDPFADVSDPFATSAIGSFYNSQEESFARNSSLTTPATQINSTNPFANSSTNPFVNNSTNPFANDSFSGSSLAPSIRNPMAQDSAHDQSLSFNLDELDSELLETLNSLEVDPNSSPQPIYATVDKSKKTRKQQQPVYATVDKSDSTSTSPPIYATVNKSRR